jgi:hypothetical protein
VPRTLLLTLGFGPIWTRPATPSRNDCFLRIRDIWATSRIGRVGVWRYRVGLHRPFRGLLSVHARCGPHTRGPQLHEGFNHFVTTMTAPVASHWSDCRVGLAPTGKRLVTTHRWSGPFRTAALDVGVGRRVRLHGSPREGPDSGREPPFLCEREAGFTTQTCPTPNSPSAPGPRRSQASRPSAQSLPGLC